MRREISVLINLFQLLFDPLGLVAALIVAMLAAATQYILLVRSAGEPKNSASEGQERGKTK